MVDRPPRTLAEYPLVRVRVECSACGRKGDYALVGLAVRYGPKAELDDVLRDLARCRWMRAKWERRAGKYEPKCLAHFPDLPGHRPPDFPPLRLVDG